MEEKESPQITAVISTRSRGDKIVNTIQTILQNDYPHFDLRVIDQSEDDSTETSLRPFLGDPRFHYLRTVTQGLSTGRNLGINSAKNEFIAITDDDCETPTNWIQELVTAFNVDHRIGIVFGNTVPAPHSRADGFIPIYVRNEPFLAKSIHDKHQAEGISACMGLRRSVWQVLNGFDEMLGAGTSFKSAEEVDFTIRALLAGYFVYETPKLTVVHHGFRTWEQGRALIHGYWYGAGAVFAKLLKCRHWSIFQLLLHLAYRWAFGLSRVASSFGNNPHRWLRLAAFVQGFLTGIIKPVDRSTGHYVRNARKTAK